MADAPEHNDGSIRMIHDLSPDLLGSLLTQHLRRKRPHGSGLLGRTVYLDFTSRPSPQRELRDIGLGPGIFRHPKMQRWQ